MTFKGLSHVSEYLGEQEGIAHAFGDLEKTTEVLHRGLAAGVSSASHRSQVRSLQWHRLGTPKHRKGTGQNSHREEGETFFRRVSSKPNNTVYMFT